jgi:hypothetical protein
MRDDLPRSPVLARIVEESERVTPPHEGPTATKQSVSERVQRVYAFD